MHTLFHNTPARREDFTVLTKITVSIAILWPLVAWEPTSCWEGFGGVALTDYLHGCSQDEEATKSRNLIFWHCCSGTEWSCHRGKTSLLHVGHQDLHTLSYLIPDRPANDAIPCERFGRIDEGNYFLWLSIVCIYYVNSLTIILCWEILTEVRKNLFWQC